MLRNDQQHEIQTDPNETVLLSTFTVNKKRSRVYLHRWKFIWETENLPHSQHTIPLSDVIAISAGDDQPECSYFVLDYAKRLNNNVWRHRRITVVHTDPRQITMWIRTIQNHLNSFAHRPKRLLLFVNPYGGKQRALKIFEKHGKPLFQIAKVDVSVIISQRQNQITDLLMHLNLNIYDAVACVGGDGTFSELFNGLLLKACKDKNINPNDANAEIPAPGMPVGVIPGGSTDTVAYCVHGTSDIQTAVLHIIFGETIGLDLASAFSQDRFIRFYASVMSYGFLGDVAKDSERFRWMGPKRYDYSGLKKILSNTGYDGELRLLCEKNDTENGDPSKCLENCNRCSSKKDQSAHTSTTDLSHGTATVQPNVTENTNTEWRTVRGKFFMVNGANVSCACAKSPNGIAPYCHIGDGCVNLVLVRHTSAFNVLRLLLRLSSRAKTINDFPFVEVYRVREFEFHSNVGDAAVSSNSTSSVWNCDGEVVKEADIHVRVHCQLLNVYSRGLQEYIEKPSCFFCFS